MVFDLLAKTVVEKINELVDSVLISQFPESPCHCEKPAEGGRRSNHDFEIASLTSFARNDKDTLPGIKQVHSALKINCYILSLQGEVLGSLRV